MTNISTSNIGQIPMFQSICDKVCSEQKIRFCGIINEMGKLIAGGFRDGIKPLDNEEERRMWYMQSALEMSMKKEFGNNLGDIDYIVTYRGNVTLINMPIQDHVILLSIEKNVDIGEIAEHVKKLFDLNSNTDNNAKVEDRYLSVSELI